MENTYFTKSNSNIEQSIFFNVEQNKVDTYNSLSTKDDGTGIQCQKCNNRGYIAFVSEVGNFAIRPCRCYGSRVTARRLIDQGLYDMAQKNTLSTYRTDTSTQKALKLITETFLADKKPHWLVICGQSGVGKTHLCTAAFVQLSLKNGMNGRYITWNSDGRKLKAAAVDGNERFIDSVKQCELLYIDDLFKCKKGSDPSDADIRIAFELLDYRYSHKLVTIISTELSINAIRQLDTGIYRRIHEMAGPYIGNIETDMAKCFIPNEP